MTVWISFFTLILVLLALDLGVFHRKAHEPTVREALAWSAFWVALSLAFSGVVYFLYENDWVGAGLAFPAHISGQDASLEFLAGYVLEKSLSLDNIFVIALIFAHFRVPLAYQHRVLFWGVLGALVMRGAMVALGATLLEAFGWMTYVFGAVLLITAGRLMVVHHDNLEPERGPLLRLMRRVVPVTEELDSDKFFTKKDGVRHATPLFAVLLVVESTDLLFAVDSIPAIFAVTEDPFIVYTSNVFAILGLRSLYFALAPLLQWFRYLRPSLVLILGFVGMKMLMAHQVHIPVTASLTVIGGILVAGVAASVVVPHGPARPLRSPVESEMHRLMRLTRRIAARTITLAVGGTIVAFGTIALVVPPVGGVVVTLGLSVLATQFIWARRLLAKARREARGKTAGRS
jgi:tellurite resistance protein TerC